MRAYGNCRGYEYPCDQPVYVKPDPRPAVKAAAKHVGGVNARKRVRCEETGMVYQSITEASQCTGLPISSVSRSLSRGKTISGRTFTAV